MTFSPLSHDRRLLQASLLLAALLTGSALGCGPSGESAPAPPNPEQRADADVDAFGTVERARQTVHGGDRIKDVLPYEKTKTLQTSGKRDRFGERVAIDGDTLVASAMWEDVQSDKGGAVYVFERNSSGVWTRVQTIDNPDASNGNATDTFGFDLALDGNTLVVGSQSDDRKGQSSGAVYVFERNEGGADQ